MAHLRFVEIVFALGLVLLGCLISASAQETRDCAALRKDFELRRQQLSQHVDALKKLYEQNEFTVMSVFNDKIRELIDEIRRLTVSMRGCPHEESPTESSGLGAVKSDLNEYATKTCDELRTLLLQLVQKTTALKRREGSLFSALTSEEKSELEEAERAFKELKAAIRSRCAAQDRSSPFRRRRR